MKNKCLFSSLLLGLMLPGVAGAQQLPVTVNDAVAKILNDEARREISVGRVKIDSVAVHSNRLQFFANLNCSYIPFRESNVASIYDGVRVVLPEQFKKHKLEIITDRRSIEELIPLALRSDSKAKKVKRFNTDCEYPLVTCLDAQNRPTKGLQNRHIAMWQSHGWYFEQSLNRWEWQRARIFQTVEDLYTQSYVLPYLVPMLENAGARVLLPRERDFNKHEVVVDNDGCLSASVYSEKSGDKGWMNGDLEGFAHRRSFYKNFENPFKEGTYRVVETLKKGKESIAEWTPAIPEDGKYAVYVAYKSLPNSAPDALYTVYHKGGVSRFHVNQQMGGGTWIYLGTFAFDKGTTDAGRVTLSNRSKKKGCVVTADGVKIGGGMGNVARQVASDVEAVEPQVSGYPRFCEAARYWMQWAGVPDSIYSMSAGKNDYTDDYKCRGVWVNYLAGGSEVLPDRKGLNIPLDLAFAFHSDAGTTLNDSIIGTLGIYMSESGGSTQFANGSSRYLAHDLTDLIQSNIVNDIRRLYDEKWSRRGKWNKAYFEARSPQVPTMLLELLSHQNFADMRFGLDPRFRFTVSRAVYKGMLQFVSSQNKNSYVVQPLPVDHLALRLAENQRAVLTWKPVEDPLEPSASPKQYVVYTRIGNRDFDNGVVVDSPSFEMALPTGVVCSFKVTALNEGGESFPSEVLSAGIALNASKKEPMLIVNGFDRISAPADFVAPKPGDTQQAGFLDDVDHGVPYMKDVCYIGKMKEFRRSVPWMDDDASGFGDSYGDYETMVIAGNTFDYPALHGEAVLKAGCSFVSCSDEAVEDGLVALTDYPSVDLILGKECQTKMGKGGIQPLQFKTFSEGMQKHITSYCQNGGALMVSGAYVASDLWDNVLAESKEADRKFATDVLKYKWRVDQAARRGGVKAVGNSLVSLKGYFNYYHELNEHSYVVESPDAVEPACKEAKTVLRYSENNLSAAVAYDGAYKTFVMGYPFESIRSSHSREVLMSEILKFFNQTENIK